MELIFCSRWTVFLNDYLNNLCAFFCPQKHLSIPHILTVVLANFHHRIIVDKVEHPGIGATEMILSNGMRVCYKCTDFLDDQVSTITVLILFGNIQAFLPYYSWWKSHICNLCCNLSSIFLEHIFERKLSCIYYEVLVEQTKDPKPGQCGLWRRCCPDSVVLLLL